MATSREKEDVLNYWNSKRIVIHKRMNPDLSTEISRTLKYYPLEEVIKFIDFYATILEPGVPEQDKKYFWSYKWNLYEFLKRGIRKFDGQETNNYLKKQTTNSGNAVVFKRREDK